jgi:hypothetical protein
LLSVNDSILGRIYVMLIMLTLDMTRTLTCRH